ncbi:MAG: DNA mismatch repair protein MutS [candidate division WOR-3 bacterium]
MERLTPLLAQYHRIKERYPGTLLLFRVGDFYEMFYEDAEIGARALNLTLTSRPHGPNHRVPLAGVPAKSLEAYVARLVAQGLKVAVCEQLEAPSRNKPVVARDVIEVITPGTVTRSGLLDERRNNYIMALSPAGENWGMAFADLSTGEFTVTEIDFKNLTEEIVRVSPAEILLPENWPGEPPNRKLGIELALTRLDDYYFTPEFAFEKLTSHFGVVSLAGFGIEHLNEGICAAGALLEYLEQTQCSALPHILRLTPYCPTEYLLIDRVSRRNLELIENLHPPDNRSKEIGTLFWVLNRTQTPQGTRLLRRWLLNPLLSVEEINRRQEAIAELTNQGSPLKEIAECLREIGDIERITAKVALGRANPREVIALRNWLSGAPKLKNLTNQFSADYFCQIREKLFDFTPLVEEISQVLVDDPPITITEGGLIRSGYNKELDELRQIAANAKEFIARLQEEERRRTGIPNLRIGYNSVFGYYIEITKSYLGVVPRHYIRKQTVAQGERFITPELKEYEAKILNAEERIKSLEYDLFLQLRSKIASYTTQILDFGQAVAQLDVLASLAEVARDKNYTRPIVDNSYIIEIKKGKHPVVEAMVEEPFIPNDTLILPDKEQILIVTGPNMAGKSTYLRQVALIVIMAQMGSFVPAEHARIGIVDKIFTRIGASDDVARGVSTFLAEMIETANILNNATSRSLVILDEVGRGTSTNDGLAIAWATVEYLHGEEEFRPRTLFATHYHELADIATYLTRVKNYSFVVRESGDQVLFLRKLRPGPADKSYGIAVAKLAGLPPVVINRAKELLKRFTKGEEINLTQLITEIDLPIASDRIAQPDRKEKSAPHPVLLRLQNLNINELSPLEALNLLAELQKLASEPDG